VRADAYLVVVDGAHDVADFNLIEAPDRLRDVERDDVTPFSADCDRPGGGVDGLHRSANRDLLASLCGLRARRCR
jgi:hypothetical protein